MPIKKLVIKPGINRENTSYSTEGGWFEGDKVRFRQGSPEQIGGWVRTHAHTFLGVCRSLWTWTVLSGDRVRGVGTNLKFYLDQGGEYHDITPIRLTTAAGDVTFAAVNGSSTITITETAHGALINDFVTFSGAVTLGGTITAAVLNHEYQITSIIGTASYTVEATDTFGGTAVVANGSDTGNGGAAVVGVYQINTGAEIVSPLTGWSTGYWGEGAWGSAGTAVLSTLGIWNQANFGEDLIAGQMDGELYYRDSSDAVTVRMTLLSAEAGASDVPTRNTLMIVSDVSRFVFVFGTTNVGTTVYDPMLVRWSDQEDAANFTPLATNQAGSLRLSRGSMIVAVKQARQEILVWTDVALYSFQYLGPPAGWGAQIVGENLTVASSLCVGYSNGLAYWMGKGKFYVYTGQSQPLECNLKRYVFEDINTDQYGQIFAGTNEEFHEVWWFYCSAESTTIDKYVVFNYSEQIWYYGTMARTAWLDGIDEGRPMAATYSHNLVTHETGVDDGENESLIAINSHIKSSDFDIDDGHNFAFVWRVIPDITFEGSTEVSPSVDLTLIPKHGSGSGNTTPPSVASTNTLPILRSSTVPVEAYTEQLNIRIRGRQMSIQINSPDAGVKWQLGTPRVDLRPDGRR
jgi:hypothetical protein